MIVLLLTNVEYEQDIRELFMAFYPGLEYAYEEKDINAETKIVLRARKNENYFIFNLKNIESNQEFDFEIKIDKERSINKSNIKKSLYKILEKINNKSLPWGTLTGIRPSKIIMDFLEKNIDIENIKKIMKETYLISEKKLGLCLEVALKEKALLDNIEYKDAYSLYVGIPFCPSTCAYCSFTSYPIDRWKEKSKIYVDCLCKELIASSKLLKDKTLQTIYMGGGTPSSLEACEIERILKCIQDNFDLRNLLEYSVEFGRPDSITKEKLEVLKKYKVGRISINPQTMHDETLKLIGRKQSVLQFFEAFNLARSLNFDNINTDIILGLPNENLTHLKYTMDELCKLEPESITVHSLAIKRAARLNTNKQDYYGLQIENTSKMIDFSREVCTKMGLHPYYMYRQKNMIGNFENVAYAKDKKECLYNIFIMEEKQNIIACGAGTSTKLIYRKENRLKRFENVKDPKLYIERIEDIINKKKGYLQEYFSDNLVN